MSAGRNARLLSLDFKFETVLKSNLVCVRIRNMPFRISRNTHTRARARTHTCNKFLPYPAIIALLETYLPYCYV